MKYQDLTLMATEFGVSKDAAGKALATFKLTVPGVFADPLTCTVDRKSLRDLQKAATDPSATWADALGFGTALADVLLPEPARQAVALRLTQAKAQGSGLRLRLALPIDLQRLPWEFIALNLAGGNSSAADFLALDPNVSIIRQPATTLPEARIAPGDLQAANMLIALASPEDQPPLDLAKERAALENLLQPIPRVKPEWVEHATPAALLEGGSRIHLFHFAGHGVFVNEAMSEVPGKSEGKGLLVFENDLNESQNLAGDVLGVALRQRGARVAVLGACHSAARDDLRQWSGVAESLLKAELGAVVGMQFAVRDASAIAFVGKFYQALLAGLTIDEAVCAGRAMVAAGQDDVRGFATPVLFLRAADGVVFPELAALPASAPEQAQLVQATRDDLAKAGATRIDLRYSQGAILGNTGTVNQHFGDTINTGGGDYVKGDKRTINTGGGAYVEGNVNVNGDFVGGNKITTQINNYNTAPELASIPTEHRGLVALLNQYFSLSDIDSLCFEMGIDDEQLRGQTKDERARSLVKQVTREERVGELKERMRTARPNLRAKLM